MHNIDKNILYNIGADKNKSCFLAFDPSDYTEVRQYGQNPAFEPDDINHLLPLANEAAVHFSRTNEEEYAVELELRYTRLQKRREKEMLKKGNLPLPAFSVVSWQAFKRPRQDFEEIISHYFYGLQSVLDNTLTNDPPFIKTGYTAQSGNFYTYPNLMAAMVLWKVDRAILAIQSGYAAEVARLLIDAYQALVIAKMPSVICLHDLHQQRKISEKKAKAGGRGPKKQEEYKADALELYFRLGKEDPWRSWDAAAIKIYGLLLDKYRELIKINDPKKAIISENHADDTMAVWFRNADPKKKFIKK